MTASYWQDRYKEVNQSQNYNTHLEYPEAIQKHQDDFGNTVVISQMMLI